MKWKCRNEKVCVGQSLRDEADMCEKWKGAVVMMVGSGVNAVEVSGIREGYRMILPDTEVVATDVDPKKRCVVLPALGGGERKLNFDWRSIGVVKGSGARRNGENWCAMGKERNLLMSGGFAVSCKLWKFPQMNLPHCEENLV